MYFLPASSQMYCIEPLVMTKGSSYAQKVRSEGDR